LLELSAPSGHHVSGTIGQAENPCVFSDRLLQRTELKTSRRYEYRSLIFFPVPAFFALTSLSLIRLILYNQ
jgi:hypothetical protein